MSGEFVHSLLCAEFHIPVVQHFLVVTLDGKHEKSQFLWTLYCFSCRPELLLNMWDTHREETIFVLLLKEESKT